MRATVDEAAEGLSIEVVEWNRRRSEWPELVQRQPGTLPALEVDSEHPYLLTYTSGTTGQPKGVLHVHGGFLVSIAREVAYQTDVNEGDVVHFATDMGWIMGPWTVVGAGAVGATIVFAERPRLAGRPALAHDRAGARTMLGASPTLIRALIPKGEPRADTSSLRAIATTGEPWNPDPYLWLHEHVGGGRTPIVNLSGGTGSARASCPSASRTRSSRCRSASRRSGSTSTSSTRRAGRCAARWASSSARAPGRG